MHDDDKIDDSTKKLKSKIITAYNKTKSGVDTLDKLVRTYTCKRTTRCWPMALFYNMLDIAAYNSLVIFLYKFLNWNKRKSHKRRIFLLELGQQLIETAEKS